MGLLLDEAGSALLDEAGSPLGDEAVSSGVVATWTASYAVPSGAPFPFPAARPVQLAVTNTAGDWLFALVTWRQQAANEGVSVCVADDAHNWWEPVGAPAADSPASGVVRTAVWAAPAARVANTVTGVTNVQVAATGPYTAMCAEIVDYAGLAPWYSVGMIGSAAAGAATTLSVSAGAPSASALLFSVVAADNSSYTLTGPGGLTLLPGVTASNGTDHSADLSLYAHYGTVTGSTALAFFAGGAMDLAGVTAGVLVSAAAPVQPSPDWPVMITEAAPGAGVQTPPSQLNWVSLSGRSLAMSMQQGKQYTLGQLSAGQGTLTVDNPDGALIPPGTGAFAGIDSGTPFRRRVIIPAAPSPHYVAAAGFLRRWPWAMTEDLLRGKTVAEIADVWAYGASPLNSMGVQECLLDQPYALWPMTDPAGSQGASNVAPGNALPLAQVVSKFGPGGATATWGTNSGSLAGLSSAQVKASGKSGGAAGMWQQQLAGSAIVTNGNGYALMCTDPGFPPISGGVTVEAWTGGAGEVLYGFTAAITDVFTSSGLAGIANGSAIVFSTASGVTFPAGITAGVVYYVVSSSGSTFGVSTTPGGSPVSITAAGGGYGLQVTPWNQVVMSCRDGKGAVAEIDVRNSDGALLLLYRTAAGVFHTLVADAATDYRVSSPQHHVSLAMNSTNWRVLVDGGLTASATSSWSASPPPSFRTLAFGGVQDSVQQGGALNGCLALAGIYPGVSPQIRVVNRFYASGHGMVNEAACDRIERVLEYAGLAGRRWLGQQAVTYEGDLCASGQDVGGQGGVSSASNIAQSTLPALLAVAPTGDVFYLSKLYAWNQPVRWTLGDNAAAGEIPFLPSVATDYDPTRVAANVQLTQLDSQSVTLPSGVMASTTMAAVAAASSGQYGGQAYQQTGYLQADWSASYTAGGSLVDLANWVANVYARPANRLQSVTVRAEANAANASAMQAWQFWAGAAVGDMVQVNVRLPTAATSPLISLTARITQTNRDSQWSQDGTSASIACALDFAPEYQALVCDDAVRGLLNGKNVLPW